MAESLELLPIYIIAAMPYRVMYDRVTAHVRLEYFTGFHPSPFGWVAIATCWACVVLFAVAVWTRSKRKVSTVTDYKRLANRLVVMAALVAGALGFILAQRGVIIFAPGRLLLLVFVVLPLLLAFLNAAFRRRTSRLWIRYTLPSAAQFPTFSVSLSVMGREDAYIVYRDEGKHLRLYAGTGEKGQVLCLAMPRELADRDIHAVAQNLAMGLVKLGFYKYKITKQGETEIIASST